MKKYHVKVGNLILLLFLSVFFLFSCKNENVFESVEGLEERKTKEEDILQDFSLGHNNLLFMVSRWSNGYPFNCKWSNDSVSFSEGVMNVTLFKENETYYGGEYRSFKRYGYGFYSVMMQPAKCDGVISSFFTYTGNPWDEIDIEFLGDDTTRVQFNYYTNGVGKHEFYYDLGFDASESMHEYGFSWEPDSITWYVDGKPVCRAVDNIPTTPGQIMCNVWNVHPDFRSWAGLFKGDNLPVTAKYKWFAFSNYEI